MIKAKSIVYNFCILVLFAILCISVALFNRFPIVLPDTGAYMVSGFTYTFLPERPIIYGLFIAITGMKSTLWLPIFAQGLIISYLIYKLVFFLKFKYPLLLTFISIVLLIFTTGFSTYASQVMPDIFTSCSIISLILLVLYKELNVIEKIILSFIFLLSTLVHSSHLFINLISLTIFSVFYFFIKRKNKLENISGKNLLLSWCLIMLTFLSVPFTNYLAFGEFKFSLTNGFLLGRFAENGILDKFLEENCSQKNNYKLCEFQNKIPHSCASFLWDYNGAFYKSGGWEDSSGEHKRIIDAIMSNPEYLTGHILESIKVTNEQIFNYRAGDGIMPFKEGSSPYVHIAWLLPGELKSYIISDQNANKLDFTSLNNRQIWAVNIGLIILAIIFLNPDFYRIENSAKIYAAILIIIFILSNAFICGTLSGVFHRYQGRIIWLLPFLSFILLINQKKMFFKWPTRD
jgi:hypothetical protein